GSVAKARVLVTGATGLVGSSLVGCLLSAGAVVHALVLPDPEPESDLVRSGALGRVRVHTGRLEDPAAVAAAVQAARPRFVFHLGAQPLVGVARAHPVATFEANVRGTSALLDACRPMPDPPIVAAASSHQPYDPRAQPRH